MKNLTCYVGLNNRFVMCEDFPNDEEHAGLHEMLEEFLAADIYIQNAPLEQGFYSIEFGFSGIEEVYMSDYIEEYLVVKKLEKVKNK